MVRLPTVQLIEGNFQVYGRLNDNNGNVLSKPCSCASIALLAINDY